MISQFGGLGETPSELEKLIEISPVAIFRERLEDRMVTYASPNFKQTMGYSARQVVGSQSFFAKLMDEEDRGRFEADLNKVISGDLDDWDDEYQVTVGDGSRRWFAIAARMQESNGHPEAILGFVADITARVRADEAAKHADDRYRSIFVAVPSGIFRSSSEGQIEEANPKLAEIFGYESAEDLKAQVPDVGALYVDPHDRERFMKVVQSEGSVQNFETSIRRRSGDIIEVSINASLVTDRAGNMVGFEGTLHDITEQRQAQEDVRLARAEADRANQAKSVFLSRMSHELRTPLNSILGFAQLLELRDLDPATADSVQHILKGGRHLLELINEVLDLAQVEAGRLAMSLEAVELSDAIADALALVRPLAATRLIALELDNDPCHEYVLADRQRFKQVLLNLLSNAIKYNRPGGKVMVSCQRDNGHLSVNIADTGPGVNSGQLERLFKPFDRLGAEDGEEEGTGLGLVLSRQLTEAMGGTLTVTSEVDVGSTFSIILTVVDPPKGLSNAVVKELAAPAGMADRERTILYIEDNLANLTLVDQILSLRPQVALESAMQGRIGMELARSIHPDLILLDVNLPDMSGRDVLTDLKMDPGTASIPVLMVSADASPGQVQRMLDAGADGYLTKPLDVAGFLSEIDRILQE